MPEVRLAQICFARPGDKGNISDLGLFAPDSQTYEIIEDQVTADRVKEHFGDWVQGDVTRWELPNILALKFVMTEALGGGGPASLRADNLGKSLGGALLYLTVDAPQGLIDASPINAGPPRDPYADAAWKVRG